VSWERGANVLGIGPEDGSGHSHLFTCSTAFPFSSPSYSRRAAHARPFFVQKSNIPPCRFIRGLTGFHIDEAATEGRLPPHPPCGCAPTKRYRAASYSQDYPHVWKTIESFIFNKLARIITLSNNPRLREDLRHKPQRNL
jgi:hypothetical protein